MRVKLLPSLFLFIAVVAPVKPAAADAPQVFCETLLEKTATDLNVFRPAVHIEHPFYIVPVLSPKALAPFNLAPRMLRTDMRVRFAEKDEGQEYGTGKVFFEILRSDRKLAYRAQITGQPVYSYTYRDGYPGMSYVVLSETAEGVRAVLSSDDFSGGAYFVASIDVPCDRVSEFLFGDLLETDEPMIEITAHGDRYCRIPVMTLHQDKYERYIRAKAPTR